jgi:hypothetical protein
MRNKIFKDFDFLVIDLSSLIRLLILLIDLTYLFSTLDIDLNVCIFLLLPVDPKFESERGSDELFILLLFLRLFK